MTEFSTGKGTYIMAIKHIFQSVKPASVDSSKVRSNDWNADHQVDDIETTDGHFFWDNTVKRLAVGYAGVYTQVKAIVLDALTMPDWVNLHLPWWGIKVNAGDLPPETHFGSNMIPLPESITGCIDLPSSVPFANHGAGIAGYGRSTSTALGGVGVFGAGLINANNVPGGWGCNFLCSNTGTIHNPVSHATPPEPGFNLTNVYGMEIDIGTHELDGGGVPNISGRGIYMVLGGSVQPLAAVFNCIDVESFSPTVCKWQNVINIADGACAGSALRIGTAELGTSGSMPIAMKTRNSSGVVKYVTMIADPDGNYVISPGTGGVVQFKDEGGAVSLQTGAGTTQVIGQFIIDNWPAPASATAAGYQGEIRWDSNFLYVAIADNVWKRCALATW